jgi:DNA-binding IclR family transcriptional regulator
MRKMEAGHGLSRARLNGPYEVKSRSAASLDAHRRRVRGKKVGAVVNAIQILRLLGSEAAPLRASDIARSLQMNPSTCFNILQTLVHEALVNFDSFRKIYWLRQQWPAEPVSVASQDADVLFLKPETERLASKHQLFVSLWRPSADNRLVLVMAAETSRFDVRMPVGSRVPMFIGSAGRVMAAASGVSEQRLKTQLAGLRWDKPPSFELYSADIASVRQNGWAVDREHFARGFVSISTPLQDAVGQVKYACSATIPSPEWSEDRGRRIAADLLALGRLFGNGPIAINR